MAKVTGKTLKAQEAQKPFRSRKMGLLLYPDNESHAAALQTLKMYPYALITHDKDVAEDGQLLKPHVHVVLVLKNAQWNTAIAKELEIEPRYIQQIRSEEAALEYLIHLNESTKHQYSVDEVQGPLKRKLVEYIAKQDCSESERAQEILKFIKTAKPSITELSVWAATEGYWDILRRASTLFIKIAEENNVSLKRGLVKRG